MPKFHCIHCGQHIDAPDEMAGSQSACPTCGGDINVPGIPKTQPLPLLKISPTPPKGTSSKEIRYAGLRRVVAFFFEVLLPFPFVGIFLDMKDFPGWPIAIAYLAFVIFRDMIFNGASPVKKLLSLHVVDETTRREPSLVQLTLRNFYSFFIMFVCILLYLIPFLGIVISLLISVPNIRNIFRGERAVHEKWSGTAVVPQC